VAGTGPKCVLTIILSKYNPIKAIKAQVYNFITHLILREYFGFYNKSADTTWTGSDEIRKKKVAAMGRGTYILHRWNLHGMESKRRSNIEKHGIDFIRVQQIFDGPFLCESSL